MLDHDAASHALIARVFDGESEGLTRDDVLDNITLYWVTNTAVSSARLYWESKLDFFAPKHVNLPTAISVFPDEIYAAPQSWAEQAYPNLIHYNRLDKGGHFAAWEEPELFATELRAGFRSLR
jgi:pimeloyl-ACP methyl ester carboxylesterase